MVYFKRQLVRAFLLGLLAWTVLLTQTTAVTGQPKTAPTALAADGKPLVPVIVAKNTSERVRLAARTLADYLGRISGAKFAVETGDGTTGVVVGLPEQFPALALKNPWDPKDPTQSEDYLLRSHGKGV